MPVVVNSTLMNCAVVFQKGKILGIVPKTYLPNYKEFYEKRWFTSAVAHPDSMNVRLCGQVVPMGTNLLFDTPDVCFGIELCEDVWAPVPPRLCTGSERCRDNLQPVCRYRKYQQASVPPFVVGTAVRLVVWLDMYFHPAVSGNLPPMWFLPETH